MSGKTAFSNNASSGLGSQLNSLKKQLNDLKSQLKAVKPTPVPRSMKNVHEREEGLKELYAEYQDNVLADYIYGLYHPDVVFKESLDIKSPSYMPVPTTTFKFKETFTIIPNSRGNFVLLWLPNYLGTSEAIVRIHKPEGYQDPIEGVFSNCYVNSSEDLDGNAALLNGWKAHTFKHVAQDFQKYRLTSAAVKVKYTGKVLDQSGMLAAAATYIRTPRSVYMYPVAGTAPAEYSLPIQATASMSQFCDFDNIRQGQWADTCSVVSDPDGITCTWVPTDPLNQVFVDNAATIDAISHQRVWEGSNVVAHWTPTNANISYAICGYGIASQTSCITVEAYYNFEIIVKQEQFPYFSPRVAHTKLLNHKETLQRVTDLVSSQGLVSHSKTHDSPSVWTKVRGAFTKAGRIAADVYPYIKPLISLLV
jgi:hypothetical protein